ncbi:MAG: hypothetical protein AB7F91_11480 [Parvularculaceae bacterium]|nr:hypothetical protein [Parvularculaceae bacterium]
MAPNDDIFDSANEAKANFDDIYNLPDPRRYYRTLGALDYRIPTEARPIFRRVMKAMGKDNLSVLDIGCSYGVNAALIQYDLEFSDLVARYRRQEMREESVAEAIFDDAAFFADRRKAVEATFTGMDVAAEAAGYARAVGLIDDAIVENLEAAPMTDDARAAVADVDLIITTGAVGYVTEKTFNRLIDAVEGPPPWIAAFSLRQFPFDAIAEELTGFGLETEKLDDRCFPQRRFRDEEEAAGALAAVEALGLDPAGLEADGEYFAEFYLAKPRSAPQLADLRL